MKDILQFGFITMIIFMIIGLIVSGFDILIGQGIATMGFTIMVWCLIFELNKIQKKLDKEV